MRRWLVLAVATLLVLLPVDRRAEASPATAGVIVHLFQWPWASVATECATVLGPKGFGGVQVSPPQEHVEVAGHPWWQD
ncbi:alpha-amylase, partial [Actinoplanes sp. NPDC051633]